MTGLSGRAVLFAAFSTAWASLFAPAEAGCPAPDCIELAGLVQSAAISAGFDAVDRVHGRARQDVAGLQSPSPSATFGEARFDLRPHVLAHAERVRWNMDARAQSNGLSAGLTTTIGRGLVAGISMSSGSSESQLESAFTHDEGLSTDHFALLHAQTAEPGTPLYLTIAVGHGWISSNMSRTSRALGRVAARDVDTTLWLGSAEAGFNWQAVAGFTLTAFVRADAARLEQDEYAEVPLDGASLTPQAFASQSEQATRSILGARAAVDIMSGNREVRLTATAGWVHDFEPIPAVQGTDDSLIAQAGLETPVSDRTRIFVGYNALFATGIDSRGAEAGLRMVW